MGTEATDAHALRRRRRWCIAAWAIGWLVPGALLLCWGLSALGVQWSSVELGPDGLSFVQEVRIHADSPGATVPERVGLEVAWTRRGPYTGVAVDPLGDRVYATGSHRRWQERDASGEWVAGHSGAPSRAIVRTAEIDGDPEGEVVMLAGFMAGGLRAYESSGARVWALEGTAIGGWLEPADLDGDGRDELLLPPGFGSDGGPLVALGSDGSHLWEEPGRRNVTAVSAADVDGDRATEVVASTWNDGATIIETDTRARRAVRPLEPTTFACAVCCPASRSGVRLVVGGMDGQQGVLLGLDAGGASLWRAALPATVNSYGFTHAEGARARPWLAIGSGHGVVCVVDLDAGTVIASIGSVSDPTGGAEVAWLEPSGRAPLLLVADERSLTAYRVAPRWDPGATESES